MKKTYLIIALASIFMQACSTHQTQRESRYQQLVPNAQFQGFGSAGNGKKKIPIAGDVIHAGDYYFAPETSLYEILKSVGPSGQSSEGIIHKIAIFTEDGKRIYLHIEYLKPEDGPRAKEIKAIYVPAIIF